jgi:hypothetical protein
MEDAGHGGARWPRHPTRDASRDERLKEFFRRLAAAPPASDHDEAIKQVTEILNQVEDDMTSIPLYPFMGRTSCAVIS